MMLTAGHCISSGGNVTAPSGPLMGSVASGSRESWNEGEGSVAMSGSTAIRGDIALIELSSGVKSTNVIYRGGATSSQLSNVVEMWSRPAAPGDQFCTGGQTTGELCGWIVNRVGVNMAYFKNGVYEGEARNVVEAYRSGVGTADGDSGGSVFTVRSDGQIAAKGIISGGGSIGGLPYLYFTGIWDAYIGFPGYVRVTPT